MTGGPYHKVVFICIQRSPITGGPYYRVVFIYNNMSNYRWFLSQGGLYIEEGLL